MMSGWGASFVAALSLVTVGLAINVSRARIVRRIPHGEGPNHELARPIRAHANSVEHLVPIGLLLLSADLLGASASAGITLGTIALVSRVFLTIGILWKGAFRLRQLGALGTYLVELGLIVLVASGSLSS